MIELDRSLASVQALGERCAQAAFQASGRPRDDIVLSGV
jgi:hypothetical protein